MFKKSLYLFFLAFALPTAAQETLSTKEWLKNYLDARFQGSIGEKDWFLEINGIKLPKKPLVEGLAALEEKMKIGNLSKNEKKELKAQFVQNYTDRMAVFLSTYQEFLESSDLEALLWDFMAQASAQKHLEKQLQQNPDAAKPTQADIDQYYKANSARFAKLGMGAAQVKEYASMELSQTKMQEWTAREVGKVKGKSEIKINKAVQKELGL